MVKKLCHALLLFAGASFAGLLRIFHLRVYRYSRISLMYYFILGKNCLKWRHVGNLDGKVGMT